MTSRRITSADDPTSIAMLPSRRRRLSLWRPLSFGIIAVLLGRASILHAVSPFALAYFCVLTELAGRKRSWPACFAVIGAWWAGGAPVALPIATAFFLYAVCRGLFFRKRSPDIHLVPWLAGAIDVAVRLAFSTGVWTRYDVLLAFGDGALVAILALIFIQCMPVLIGKDLNKNLRSEQLISIAILVGSIMTGLSGLDIRGVALVQIAINAVVLLMASVGGAGAATTVAIVVGVLAMLSHGQSLPDIAILAFSALLAGVLKEAGRFWSGLAFTLSYGLLTVGTHGSWASVESALEASVVATLLYFAVPKRALRYLAAYVPGTEENRTSDQERVRRVRSLLSEKIREMSQVFEELSVTFADTEDNPAKSAQQLLNHVVGAAAESVCQGCARRTKCWEQESFATYQSMLNTLSKLESYPDSAYVTPTHDLKERCIRIDNMMQVLRHNLELTERDAQWLEKMREQKLLVSAQLSGVANVIRTIAGQMDKDNASSLSGEEQVVAALQQLGLYVDHVRIVSLEPGKVEIEVTQPSLGAFENSVRVIAPLLSGIVGENISVRQVTSDEGGPCVCVFTSAMLYDVKTAVANLARDGRFVSGDTYASVDLGNGRYAVAVSDGMGNGERARRESKAAIELLKKLLKAGFDEQLAIHTVNSALLLRSKDEMFTTLDIALIDLFSARTEFLKIGSAPSFIKRGSSVHAITGANVPIGILQDIEVQSVEEELRDRDILILMSDGVYDAAPPSCDKEAWMKQQIEQLETTDPQEIADILIESAARITDGQIHDDMTVMVAVISRHQPEWATIKVPGIVDLREAHHGKRGA